VRERKAATRNLSAEVDNEFCSLSLTSLTDQPVASAPRLLLTTGARVANQGMTWNEKRTGLTSDGTPGMMIEPVSGTITLRDLTAAKSVMVQPLDGAGRALGAPREAVRSGVAWSFRIGEPATPWYLVTVER
jgi:hypothetical protein